jgi:hypothetical protein
MFDERLKREGESRGTKMVVMLYVDGLWISLGFVIIRRFVVLVVAKFVKRLVGMRFVVVSRFVARFAVKFVVKFVIEFGLVTAWTLCCCKGLAASARRRRRKSKNGCCR